MSTDETNADQVPDRDPAPETEAGQGGGEETETGRTDGGGQDDGGGDDPSSPEAIEHDPSTAGGPSDDVPDEVERLRGG